MPEQIKPNFPTLIPELPAWNNGAGIDAEDWISCVGNFELAVGYSLVFWPSFVLFDGYVLREGFLESSLRGFENATGRDRRSVEAVMNHIHIADLHADGTTATEAQLRYLGRVLKDIYEVKLKRDFPRLQFTVVFNDEDGLDLTDYQLTFWQSVD